MQILTGKLQILLLWSTFEQNLTEIHWELFFVNFVNFWFVIKAWCQEYFMKVVFENFTPFKSYPRENTPWLVRKNKTSLVKPD